MSDDPVFSRESTEQTQRILTKMAAQDASRITTSDVPPSPVEKVVRGGLEPLERKRVSDIIYKAHEPLRWVIRGFLADGTFGFVAGEYKSLKSYIGILMDLAILSGEPLFGHFKVERQGPVVVFVGEGGEIPYLRRVNRLREAMGLDKSVLEDYYILTQTATITSDRFQEALTSALEGIGPVLVRMDPLYTYHGADTDGRNVNQEGGLLNRVSGPVTDAGSNLMIVAHFNQSGTGFDLKRIAGAGTSEWPDSWILVRKASSMQSDVRFGHFYLDLKIGSRQWGGTDWRLELNIGFYDFDLGDHTGDVSWSVTPLTKDADTDAAKHNGFRKKAMDVLIDYPWELPKTQLKKELGAHHATALKWIDSELKNKGTSALLMQCEVPLFDRDGNPTGKTGMRMGLNRTHPLVPDDYPHAPSTKHIEKEKT